MAISWTKKWTTADDISMLGGAQIGQMQDDIASAVNFVTGVGPNQIVQLDSSSRLPAVDGSLVTGITGAHLTALSGIPSGAGVIPVANIPAGISVQVVNASTGELITGTTTFPADDTIPQITEGNEAISVAITPLSATNKLKIDMTIHFTTPSDSGGMAALFRAGTNNALACMQRYSAANSPSFISFSHFVTAGSTSSLTFSVRVGQSGAGTVNINGASGSRVFGGALATSITITEIKA